ncbi:hypothetical protein JMJ35_008222 [Cladonia borealis]|uniref:Uncharacterized protein n=1 Tax=Cladonia borealis TaxID=184061 RepID=A0AA39QY27_9LECA|nr:hypothetical protein JMJ35_008222 [Cladonia borealis]
MGNLCGKPSKESDPFSQPGRTVGSTPPSQSAPRAGVPKITGQGHTLGGSSTGDRDEARNAAARAAEERAAKANQPKGKLERDLAKQKAQTRVGTLENISRDERNKRDADQTAQTISYN